MRLFSGNMSAYMVEIHIYGKLRKHAEDFTPAGKITQTLESDSCDTLESC